jgi:hypothetical protein
VQKPKATIEGTCFLRPKASDKEKMKSLPPVEDDVDPDGVQGATIVADSDDEHEEIPAPPHVVPVTVVEPAVVEEVIAKEAIEETVEEVKPKKKIVRKKTDA